MIKVITYNCGLLIYDLLGYHLFEPTPYSCERIHAIPDLLIDSEADIIFLQEVYLKKHKKFIIDAVKEQYPYSYYSHRGFKFAMEKSLVILSKNRLNNTHAYKFKHNLTEEYIFSTMGFTHCETEISNKKYQLINLHLTAGGRIGPEHLKSELLRTQQIDELMTYIKVNNLTNIILAGDLNCGPDVSKQNYHYLLSKGFTNLIKQRIKTWDPLNHLNKNGIHKTSPAQYIDHILVSNELADIDIKKEEHLIFTEELKLKDGRITTASDHYGVQISLLD